MSLGQHINRTTGTKFVTPVKDDTGSLVGPYSMTLLLVHRRVEGLGVDYHHMHTGIAGKGINLRELLGVVDEVLHTLAVLLGEVLLHALKALEHTFTNGDAWHHHHKLGPAITCIQFIHGLDVCIGFARTRFHLDGERQAHAGQFLKIVNWFQPLFGLYSTYVLANGFTGKDDVPVAESLYMKESSFCPLVNDMVTLPIALRLSGENIHHTASRFRLEALMFIS